MTTNLDALPRLLEALAHDCDNTDGWEGAATDLRLAATTLTTLSDKNAKLVEALTKCRDKFLHYEQLHRLKCTSEGDEKADRNRDMADMCSQALGDQPHD